MIVYEYDLDMVPGLTQGRTVVSLSQYDDNFFINFHLYTRNGSFVIESGTTARIRGTKPDGNGFSATATVDANDMTVLVEGDKQMTAAAGTSQYELTLMKGTKELNTANFDVYIERAALDIDTPASETKLRELYDMPVDDILETAQAIIDTADEIKTLVRNGWIYENAEGSVASFSDGGDGLPVKSAMVNVDPVQDLHGYSKPWMGGAGKNLLQITAQSQTFRGATFSFNSDGTFTVTGTSTASIYLSLSENCTFEQPVILTGCPSGGSTTTYYLYLPGTSYSDTGNGVTIPAGNYNEPIRIYIREGLNLNLIFKPMIRLASVSDATFEPYSNICPITGHTSAAITRAGKNLLQNIGSSFQENGLTFTVNNDGSVTVNGTATATTRAFINSVNSNLADILYPYVGQNVICAGCPSGGGTASYYLDFSKLDGSSFKDDIGNGQTITLADLHGVNAYVRINIMNGVTCNNLTFKPMIRLASDPAGFEPYQGHVYNITFPDAAGTVYGGTLDLNAGRLTVDKANIASYSGQSINAPWLSSMDEYAEGRTPTTGAQVVYPLATPVTYNFTAEEITTLLGINHIWADTGDVSVEYAADPKLYINKVIANALNA